MLLILRKLKICLKFLMVDMKAILNYQNPIIGDNDILVIDGEKQLFAKTEEQLLAYSKLDPSMAEILKIPFFYKKLPHSDDFKLYVDKDKGIIFVSVFEDKDEKGRNVCYSFYHRFESEYGSIKNTLENYSILVSKKVKEGDLILLGKMLDLYSKSSIFAKNVNIFCGVFFLLIVILIFILFASNGK